MKRAIILHGTLGSPEGNWFAWLRGELENQGLEVWLPQLPHADQPSLSWWLRFVHENRPFKLDSDTVVIGHSSGAILALLIAQQNPVPLRATVAVSVFHDNSLDWEPNAKLFDVPFDWQAIQAKAGSLLFVHSDTDPYVPLDQAQFVAKNCGGELVTMPGQGHFNLEQGPEYAQFTALLDLMAQRGML